MAHASDSNHDHARVYNELKAMVRSYRFRPGEQLLIGELADWLRVSSTPVREALIRLQTEDLLDPMPRRGFFARILSAKEMIDLYELCALILKRAIVHSKHGIDARTLEEFRACAQTTTPRAFPANDDIDVVPDARVKQCADYVERIYRKIACFSRNEVMIASMGNIIDRTHYIRRIDLEMPDRFNQVLRGISDIIAAVQAGDVTRAVAALDRDLRCSTECLPAIIREGINRAYAQGTLAPPTMHNLSASPRASGSA